MKFFKIEVIDDNGYWLNKDCPKTAVLITNDFIMEGTAETLDCVRNYANNLAKKERALVEYIKATNLSEYGLITTNNLNKMDLDKFKVEFRGQPIIKELKEYY